MVRLRVYIMVSIMFRNGVLIRVMAYDVHHV